MSENIKGFEVSAIAVNYAYTIEAGWYTFAQVNKRKKSDTALVLVLWGDEDLVTDPFYLSEAKKRIAEAEDKKSEK